MPNFEYQPVLKYLLIYMSFNFLNPMKNSRAIRILNYINAFTLALYIFWYTSGVVYYWVDLTSVAHANLLSACFMTFIKAVSLTYYKENLKDALLMLRDFWQPSKFPDHEKRVLRIYRNALFTVIILIILAYLASVPPMAAPFILNSPAELPIKLYPICDLTTSPCYEILYGYLLCYGYLQFMPIHMYIEILFIATIAYIYTGIEMIKIGLSKLDLEQLTEDEAVTALQEIIAQHILVLRFVKEIKRIFSIPLFAFFWFTSLSEITGLYMLSKNGLPPDMNHIISYGPVVGIFFVQMLYYCIPAAIIEDKIRSLGDAIYDLKWYSKTNARVRRTLAFMILRSQLDESFTIGNMTKLNLETFVRTARLIFSFYTLLRERSI